MGGGASKKFGVKPGVTGQDEEAQRTFQMLELSDEDVNTLYAIFVKLDAGKVNRITISSILSFISVGNW